jgi:hypothetical protein
MTRHGPSDGEALQGVNGRNRKNQKNWKVGPHRPCMLLPSRK